MGDERNTHLTRIRDWLLLRINSKKRAKPLSNWQVLAYLSSFCFLFCLNLSC